MIVQRRLRIADCGLRIGILPGARFSIQDCESGIRDPQSAIRKGFTLIELLVVILIILIVSAVALPVVLPAFSHRQVSEAARILQGAFIGAHDNAIHNNQPSGIRLLPDPTFNGIGGPTLPNGQPNPYYNILDPTQILACNRIIPIDPAPEYSEGYVSVLGSALQAPFTSTAALAYSGDGGGFYPLGSVLMIEESTFVPNSIQPNPPTSWFWNIRVGDRIQINNAGPWYTIVGPMAIGPTGGNSELFVNVGPPGVTFGSSVATSPLPRLNFAQQVYYPDFLFLVNGQDDNNNGWADEGWDGFDNNGNGLVDENTGTISEWEVETWQGSIPNHGVTNQPYTIQRRPAPSSTAREVALPTNVVIDLTTWGYPSPSSPSLERSRIPAGAFNHFTGYTDIVVNPDGTIVPTTIYSTPASAGLGAAFIHLWLAERGDLAAPDTTQTSAPFLPLPQGIAPARFAGGLELKGEYRLVTIFNRTGQVSTNETVPFDSPTLAAAQNRAYNTNLPYTAAQQGISGGP